jgi:putative ABC transport system permease protein
LRSIGFTLEEIRKQYQVRLLLVSGLGILLGTIAANTIGQKFALLLGSFMGASNIQFVVNPKGDLKEREEQLSAWLSKLGF